VRPTGTAISRRSPGSPPCASGRRDAWSPAGRREPASGPGHAG
jgi:hypothetical protein